MIYVPFFPVCLILTSLWLLYRALGKTWRKPHSLRREIAVHSMFVYLLGVVKLTFTPLNFNLFHTNRVISLVPFVESIRMLQNVNLSTSLYNLVGNLVMLVPLGFLLAYIYPRARSVRSITLYSFGLSLSIESLQYLSATRIFDIDDIILNTLGGVIGYLFFYLAGRKLHPVAISETRHVLPSLRMMASSFAVLVLAFGAVFAYSYVSQPQTVLQQPQLAPAAITEQGTGEEREGTHGWETISYKGIIVITGQD
jgi:glycopeptide antibiotics resistance protein